MRQHQSEEDYLETILILHNRNGNVRSIDIATELEFSKPSVSIAMKKLKEKKYIEINDNGNIKLTEVGYKIANETLEKHTVISDLLISIGVSKEVALSDACKIEHFISDETFTKLKESYDKKQKREN